MDTRSTPSTSAKTWHRISSCGVRGARPSEPAVNSGAGNARRSSFPFGVNGSASRTITTAG
ncbi:hypothetical protein, partial [Streptomyces sp. LamerLS-31b]|uniref:hypothetical protein n=1 Tax=Streptomyces sp. LamerLS-31b TaxID=1839765 RepID=UPI001EFB78EC